jgi:hypothetical protein
MNPRLLLLSFTLGASAWASTAPRLPAWFEPSADGAFIARSGWHRLRLDAGGALVQTPEGGQVRLALRGARAVRPEGLDPLPGRSHYFVGRDRNAWRRGVAQFARVRQAGIYDGVDLVYYPQGRELEYDFVVAPGADPSRIRVAFEGARSLRLDSGGALLVETSAGSMRQHPPRIYQDVVENGSTRRVAIPGRYRLLGRGQVGFEVARWNRRLALVIDPVLTYSGYFGSSGYDVVQAVAADRQGGYWITGSASASIELPESQNKAPKFSTIQGQRDVFVARLAPSASGDSVNLVYIAYFGGGFEEEGTAIALDALGQVYVAGWTTSNNWPVSANAPQTEIGEQGDAFVLCLNPNEDGDDSLVFSTFFGKLGREVAQAVAVRPNGRILIAGSTSSGELPGVSEASFQPSNRGGWDGFLAEIDPSQSASAAIVFATFFGGNGADAINAIGLDSAGRVYICGLAASDDLPLGGDSYQPGMAGNGDVFVAVFDTSKAKFDALTYSTYFGGSGLDVARAMVVDAAGTVWLTGYTQSGDFPLTPGAVQGGNAGGTDAFLAHLNPKAGSGGFLIYASYLGGNETEVANALVLLSATEAAVAGYTMSGNFPRSGEVIPESVSGPSADIFVAAIDTAKSGPEALTWSGALSGRVIDVATGLARDAAGNLVVCGYSTSPNLPATDGRSKPSPNGYSSGFLVRLSAAAK